MLKKYILKNLKKKSVPKGRLRKVDEKNWMMKKMILMVLGMRIKSVR